MDTEQEILAYLYTFGNTREGDLIDFGVQKLGKSSEDMKRILDELTVEGRTNRVVHEKLASQATYVTLGDPGLELQLENMADDMGLTGERKRTVIEETKRIIEDVESVAKRRIRKKFPETKPCVQSRVFYEKKHAPRFCRVSVESSGNPLLRLQMEIVADSLRTTDERRRELAEQATQILREALIVAERRIKRKFQIHPSRPLSRTKPRLKPQRYRLAIIPNDLNASFRP